MRTMVRCIICDQRPTQKGGFCAQCNQRMDNERKAKAKVEPRYYLTYQGHVVGLFPNGAGLLKAQFIPKRNPDTLPKRKTINLNEYCDGYTRDTIKRFKACVLKVAHA